MATSPIFTQPKIKHMKHKLIKTENYLLVVDELEIKESRLRYIFDNRQGLNGFIHQVSVVLDSKLCPEIIAHLPLNNSPILEGVFLLPPLEDDIDLMYENIEDLFHKKYDDALHYYSFKEGYNKAKEMYKYTEEDIRKAWNTAYIDALAIDEETYKPLFFEDFIQSLQQPKFTVGFECEKVTIWARNRDRNVPTLDDFDYVPKTTTNSQGQTQLVGTYIYE
jgi:hypothetical protein